ncbi:response regulator transcription factor [Paenibacillus contaminans]|uniref:DNA-binding response regulator n=1 Tax=Paenibacillus contaminans TaxID=450362 RepID=A0A329MRB7_9BACL|nr:response regulator [Paenibacillus contaminans]RAV22485.1 hypothetical protein DQG23_05985 [Paenibacillus contaminans]
MYTVMIADDEDHIRTGMPKLISALDNEWEVCGSAANGLELLELLEAREADLVIMDIRMPHMDGFELLKRIRQENLEIPVILITGFQDFAYAQKALRLGAMDILTKPIDWNELKRALTNVKQWIRDNRDEAAQQKTNQYQMGRVQKQLREKLVTELIEGIHINPVSIKEELKELGIPYDKDSFATYLCYISVSQQSVAPKDFAYYSLSFKMIAEESLQAAKCPFAAICLRRPDYLMLFLYDAGEDRVIEEVKIRFFIEELTEKVKALLPLPWEYGLSGLVTSIGYLREGYTSAKTDFLRKQYVSWAAAENGQMQEDFRMIADYIGRRLERKEWNESAIRGELAGWQQMREPLAFRYIVMYGLVWMNEIADQRGLFPDGGKGIVADTKSIMVQPTDELITLFASKLKELNEMTARQQDDVPAIHAAKQYIHSHLDEQLTLSSVARHVYVHPNYLSYLFTKETNTSFIQYVNWARIQQAKERLAHTDQKIIEIAESLGYRSSTYFSRVFQKETGLSPKEYRQAHKGNTAPDYKFERKLARDKVLKTMEGF